MCYNECGSDFMYQVEILRLDHQGRGIGKINDKIIFIPASLPGDVIEAEIVLEKKKFYEGKINKILKKSSKRIEPICPNFSECGGCQLLNMTYSDSLSFKRNKVQDIMNKYLSNDIKINEIIPADEPLNYRNKVTFQINNQIGFYKEKTNTIIPINECFIADNKINNIIDIIKNTIDTTNINQIIIKCSKNIEQMMVIFKTNNVIDENNVINCLKDKVNSIYISDKLIYGKDKIIEILDNLQFYISPTSFFQVNTIQAEKLYQKAIEYANIKSSDLVLDLYCGTGTIGILASKHASRVIGIELNSSAIVDANLNKELNNINNIEFFVGDTGKLLSNNNYKPNIIIVDPPRSGLDELAIKEILNILPNKLIYISCDPMTLARDLKILSDKYDIKEITPVDMFPYTAHVECVCVLSRH